MLNNLKFEINDFGPINNVNMEIGKINVISGKNSTGKSTTSKLLYAFLRSNASTIVDLANKTISKELSHLIIDLRNYVSHSDDFYENEKYIGELYEIYKIHNEISDSSLGINQLLEDIIEISDKLHIRQGYRNNFDDSVNYIKNLIRIRDESPEELFVSSMKKVFRTEFGKNILLSSDFNCKLSGNFSDSLFVYSLDSKINPLSEGWFNLEDVFYLDSFSLFDIIKANDGLPSTEHASYLFKSLKDDSEGEEMFAHRRYPISEEIEQELIELMGGYFVLNENELSFIQINSDDEKRIMKNTASGVKQLGIIQLLVSNKKLENPNKDIFLMIDEPEVNLHPIWQIKLAEILVKISKKMDVFLYLNTHSPLFIEAIRTYSNKYDLLDETKFYLSDSSDIEGKFDIFNIPLNELYIIYDILGQPYEDLNKISIETDFAISELDIK